MRHFTKAIFIAICVFLLSVPLFACSVAADASGNPISYQGFQLRTKTDNPGIRSLYTVDMEAVRALEAKDYTVEFGAVLAYAPEGGAVSTARDITLSYNGSGYTPNVSAVPVLVYSTDDASYASNKFVYTGTKTAAFAYTVIFSPEYQTKEIFNKGFVALGFCHVMKNGETVAMYYSYGEGENFGMESSKYGKTVSLYNLTSHWVSEDNTASSEAIRNNRNLQLVMQEQSEKSATVSFETPLSLASGASTESYKLANMREGIYKVTVGYTASTKYYHKLTYNDRAVVQYINAGTDATLDVFYVHLNEGDNKVSFTAQTGAITLNSLTFTMVEELSDVTAISASIKEERERIVVVELGSNNQGDNPGHRNDNDHRYYRLRDGGDVAILYENMKAGYYNVYAIGSASANAKVTVRSIVGTAADGGETLTTLTTSIAQKGNGSNGSGGAMISLGTVQLYEGGNTLHLAFNASGAQLLFNEILLVPATYTVTYRDMNDKVVSVQKLSYGETPVRPSFEIPEGYAVSEYFSDNLPIKADTDFTLPVYRTAPLTASTENATVNAPSGVSVDENGYVPLEKNQKATVSVTGATAGYYDVYLDFTATSQTKYLNIVNASMTATTKPRYRTRLETSEIGTEAYACTVWLENGENTLEIYPEANYGFKIRGVKLVNVADASTAAAHIISNTYDASASTIVNSNNDTGTSKGYNNLIQRKGDVIAFPKVTIVEDGAYRLYAVGNISKNVTLTLSTIGEGKNVSERVAVKTFTASADSSHGTSTSTVLMAINGEDDSFNLSAGTYAFTLEATSYLYTADFFLVRVGDKKAEPLPEEPDYVLPENPVDIYKDYMPDTIAPTKINEVLSSTYMAGGSGENDVYVHKLLVGVDELGLGIYTIVAHPADEGEYPGVMFIHGGSGRGDDFYEGVIDAAKKGYIAVAYDQPGIAAADCPSTGYNGPNYKFDFKGNPYAATMYKSVVGGLTVFNLLYSNGVIMDDNGDSLSGISVMQDKIAINGISWGGNMTTMLTGLLGDYVDVAVAKYCTGNYLLSEYWYSRILGQVGSEEMLREFCKYFDPSSFAEGITAKFYVIATSQDTYGSLPAVIGTYEKAVNAECRDFVTVPNQNHGTTNLTNGANRKGMCTLLEWNYLHYALMGEGTAPVTVTVTDTATDESTTDVTFTVSGEVTEMSLWYSSSTAKWTSSTWTEVTDVVDNGDGTYTVTAPITTGTYYVMVELANGDQYSSVPVIVK